MEMFKLDRNEQYFMKIYNMGKNKHSTYKHKVRVDTKSWFKVYSLNISPPDILFNIIYIMRTCGL